MFRFGSVFAPFFPPFFPQLVPNLGGILVSKILLFRPERLLEDLRVGFLSLRKKDIKLNGSRDRFLIDFGKILGAAGGAKIVFSLRRESNFDIFGYLNLRGLLDP